MNFPNPTPCFWLEPVEMSQRSLRRYTRYTSSSSSCATGWHEARVVIDERVPRAGDPTTTTTGDHWSHVDPRWPKECACGYRFADDDAWQLFLRQLWRRTDTGELTTLEDAPPGAMFDADWMHWENWTGPDGRCLTVKCPNGLLWHVDGPAKKADEQPRYRAWTRTGEPPLVTVTPSIAIGYVRVRDAAGNPVLDAEGKERWVPSSSHYHGFLRGGVLTPG